MKTLLLLATLSVLPLASASADPSDNGLTHRNSDFSPNRTAYPVPDNTGSLALLSLGLASILIYSWRKPPLNQ